MKDSSYYFERLYAYCKSQEWRGYDPYDGLNSALFRATPFYRSKLLRQIWTQVIKNSPVNLRRLVFIQKGYNPKALALFISALVNAYRKTNSKQYLEDAVKLGTELEKLATKGFARYCWGYNFPWQSRSFYAPIGTPNAICTSFASNAFIDLYEATGTENYLAIARSCADFFLNDLARTGDDNKDEFCFSYTTRDKAQVHNVNLLVASFLTRLSLLIKQPDYLQKASAAVAFSIRHQNQDGSWYYGTAGNQKWIDGFHTGYNLVALKRFSRATNDARVEESLKNGYNFYASHFLHDDGMTPYYHDQVFPIDIHSVAQGIITYSECTDIDSGSRQKARRILQWALDNMYAPERGYFYFQKKKFNTIKIPYIRWSQAWMLYALSYL